VGLGPFLLITRGYAFSGRGRHLLAEDGELLDDFDDKAAARHASIAAMVLRTSSPWGTALTAASRLAN